MLLLAMRETYLSNKRFFEDMIQEEMTKIKNQVLPAYAPARPPARPPNRPPARPTARPTDGPPITRAGPPR